MSLEKPPACNMAIDPFNTNVLIKGVASVSANI